jgi:glutathione S-transferase
MKLTLYNSMVSGNCYKVRLMLSHLGIRATPHEPTPEEMAARNASIIGKTGPLEAPLGIELELHELDVVDRSNRPTVIGHLSPVMRVPVLVLEDSRPLIESNAIVDYLAERTRYLPADPYERAQALAWQFFEQYEIEPNLAVARFWKLYDLEPSPDHYAGKLAAGKKGLEALERGLAGKEWLVGAPTRSLTSASTATHTLPRRAASISSPIRGSRRGSSESRPSRATSRSPIRAATRRQR